MSPARLGILYCLGFVTLEAAQAVYLGAVFQQVDSFLVGAWVFGISVIGCTLATALLRPAELRASLRAWRLVLALNLAAAVTWTTYFLAIQLIEPAVVFTIFSGMVPLGMRLGARLGMKEARFQSTARMRLGNLILTAALLGLATITVLGLSGFARGGPVTALAGLGLTTVSGGCTAFVILCSVRLNRAGVGPLAQFGLRFVLYTLLACAAVRLGIDAKPATPPPAHLAQVVLIGLGVIALPLYLVQKAVPLLPATTIAALTALGPAMVFALQLLDGRVAYAPATLAGLVLYMIGALLAASGTAPPHRTRPHPA